MLVLLSWPCPGLWLWLLLLLMAVPAAGGGSEHPRLREAVLRDLARGKVEVSAGGGRGSLRGSTGARRVSDGVSTPADVRRVTAKPPQGGTYRGRAGAGSWGFPTLSRARPATLRR